MSIEIVEYKDGRVDINMDDYGFTTGDGIAIEQELDDLIPTVGTILIPHVELGHLTQDSYFQVSMLGDRMGRGFYHISSFNKVFPVMKIYEYGDFIDDMGAYLNMFSGPSVDYTAAISQIRVRFIPEDAGGCNKDREVLETHDEFIVKIQRSTFNNCLFKTIKKELDWERVTKKKCNEERMRIGVKGEDVPIPISKAVSNYDFLRIYHKLECKWYGNGNVELLYLDGHFAPIVGMKYKFKCDDCYKSYFRRHSCIADKYDQCYECGAYHDESKPCDPKKLEYFARHILEDTTVKTLRTKKKKDDNDLEDLSFVLHFDIETYRNGKSIHTPYIIGSIFNGKYKTFKGDNCVSDFVDYVFICSKKIPVFETKKYTYLHLNAYNGSRFDYYLIIGEFLRRKINFDSFGLTNGAIVIASAGNIKFFDLQKHMSGSLKNNLKEFNCSISKGEFNHDEATRWEEMPDEMKSDVEKYLILDVKGLAELYEKFDFQLQQQFDIRLCDYVSTGHITFDMWKERTASVFSICLPTPIQEKNFRSSIYGGRCYVSKRRFYSSQREDFLNGDMSYDEVDDYVRDLDVVSLYPTAMLEEYPIGRCYKIKDVALWNDYMRKNMRCKTFSILKVIFVPNRNLAHSILPRREKGLKWDLEPGNGWYCSVDIDNALENGYDIEIEEGWYWVDSGYVFKDFITDLYKQKKEAKKGTSKYTLAKLFLNALYGKMVQRPVYKESKWCKNIQEAQNFFATHHTHELEYIENMIYVAGFNKDDSSKDDKVTKPTHLGAFILAYSRKIMLKYMKKCNPYYDSKNLELKIKNDFFYTDTDSLQVHASNVCETGFDLGDIGDDLGGAKILKGIWISPKLYMLEYIKSDSGVELFYHFRGKGISQEGLCKEAYEWMEKGVDIQTCRNFSFKKINVNIPSTFDCSYFNIIHFDWDKTIRVVNKMQWNGRDFSDEVHSLPWGANWHEGKKRKPNK